MEEELIDGNQVAQAHNDMYSEYDEIHDLWYSHLYDSIHEFILANLKSGQGKTALDVGCGTGFQTLLLARAGYKVNAFDIADQLVALAKIKAARLNVSGHDLMFNTSITESLKSQSEILDKADSMRGQGSLIKPEIFVGDAIDPNSYKPGNFDVITCCGSVLSFITDDSSVIELMAKNVRPGGYLFIEVEQKVNLDLIWPIIDILFKGMLNYKQSMRLIRKNLFSRPGANLYIDYPFCLSDGTELTLPVRLYSIKYLNSIFKQNSLKIVGRRGIHSWTNLIPSTLLHHQHPGKLIQTTFNSLSKIEKLTAENWPVWRFGCSVIYCLKRI